MSDKQEACNRDWQSLEKILLKEEEAYDRWERWWGFESGWNIQQARINKLEEALEEVRSDLKAMLARLGVVDSKGKIVKLTAQEIGRYINNITEALSSK